LSSIPHIYLVLRGKGTPIPANDMWIAASVMQNGFPSGGWPAIGVIVPNGTGFLRFLDTADIPFTERTGNHIITQ